MNIVLHIGTHKTGTTSFQRFLNAEKENLRSLGVEILTTPSEINYRNKLVNRPGWLNDYARSMAAKGCSRLVVSHEVISAFNKLQLESLYDEVSDYDPVVVVSFRHWVSFLVSRWAQNSRRRDAQSFPGFMRRVKDGDKNRDYYWFDRCIKNLTSVGFETVRVVSWDNSVKENSLIYDLACAAGVWGSRFSLNGKSLVRENKTNSVDVVEKVRLFNALRSDQLGLAPDELFESQMHESPAPKVSSLKQFGAIERLLSMESELSSRLQGYLDDSRTTIELKPDEFALRERCLEEACRSRVHNLKGGKLFANIDSKQVQVSSLEYEDLPKDVKNKMKECLMRGRRRFGISTFLRRFYR